MDDRANTNDDPGPAPQTDDTEPTIAGRPPTGRPLSIDVISGILIVAGGALEGYAVSVVGLFAGMYGVYGVLVLTNSPTDDRANWATTVGLIAVGAASIAVIGLLSGAWRWLTAATPRRSTLVGPSPTA